MYKAVAGVKEQLKAVGRGLYNAVAGVEKQLEAVGRSDGRATAMVVTDAVHQDRKFAAGRPTVLSAAWPGAG